MKNGAYVVEYFLCLQPRKLLYIKKLGIYHYDNLAVLKNMTNYLYLKRLKMYKNLCRTTRPVLTRTKNKPISISTHFYPLPNLLILPPLLLGSLSIIQW